MTLDSRSSLVQLELFLLMYLSGVKIGAASCMEPASCIRVDDEL